MNNFFYNLIIKDNLKVFFCDLRVVLLKCLVKDGSIKQFYYLYFVNSFLVYYNIEILYGILK